MPNGAVASWLEKAGKKKTTFRDVILLEKLEPKSRDPCYGNRPRTARHGTNFERREVFPQTFAGV
jgi:hypothetical protein